MKGLNKFLAAFFSLIIVLVCVLLILYVGNIITSDNIMKLLDMLICTKNSRIITTVVLAIIGVSAIGFGVSTEINASSNGGSLTLPLSTGNISISAQTFETMVLNVAKKYNNLRNVKANVNIREDGLYVELFVYILEGTVVSDILCKIQEDIKSSVLKQTTVEVKMVEVKVKGIYNLNENKLQD